MLSRIWTNVITHLYMPDHACSCDMIKCYHAYSCVIKFHMVLINWTHCVYLHTVQFHTRMHYHRHLQILFSWLAIFVFIILETDHEKTPRPTDLARCDLVLNHLTMDHLKMYTCWRCMLKMNPRLRVEDVCCSAIAPLTWLSPESHWQF